MGKRPDVNQISKPQTGASTAGSQKGPLEEGGGRKRRDIQVFSGKQTPEQQERRGASPKATAALWSEHQKATEVAVATKGYARDGVSRSKKRAHSL